MTALRPLGSSFPLLLMLMAIAALSTGCNFFGKETPGVVPPPGQLHDGTSVVGAWSASFSDVSTSDAPSVAYTMTYTFTGSGSASIEIRDQLSGGSVCTGSGPYQVDNTGNVDIAIQAIDPPICSFPPNMTLAAPVVSQYSISYTDPSTGFSQVLFAVFLPPLQIVGVWQFNGQGGIDYVFFDQTGYFLLQTEDTPGQPYLIQGYYTLNDGTLTLNFFQTDASSVVGSVVFTSISNTGQQLSLTETTSQGTSVLTGTLL